MSADAKEAAFQQDIIDQMIEGGWKLGDPASYDRERALYTTDCLEYVQTTQPKTWEKYKKLYPSNPEQAFIDKLAAQLGKADPQASDKSLRTFGTLGVLRHELRDKSASFKLCQFKPDHGLNPETQAMYEGNILRVVPELVYSPYATEAHLEETGTKAKAWRIDLVLFLNGIPIVTMELKSEFKQAVENACRQYKRTRLPKDPETNKPEPLLTFKRGALVHFAVSQYEAYMTTKLEGGATRFLPFNQGTADGGAGNDPPEDVDTYATAYLWNEVLAPANLLQIIGRFIHLEIKTEEAWDGRKTKKETLIFPRYHQWDLVTRLVQASREEGPGHKYLAQHSAGSGKSNSIAWTAHQLSSLYDDQGEKVFHSIIVVTDRTVLDDQLQDTIYQFEHADGVVGRINREEGQGSKSEKLAAALETSQPIVIVTIQTFPHVLKAIESSVSLKERRYAIIADEAHSSQSGSTARQLKEVLTAEQKPGSDDGAGEDEALSSEDMIAATVASRRASPNLSYYAFTATPKSKTLELFGRLPNPEEPPSKANKPRAFHVYSMRQAIEENYILDVLKNYTSYKVAYNLAQKMAAADAEVDSKKAKVKLAQWVRLHDYNIAQKVMVIVEHFRGKVMGLLNGHAKAMVVTGSRKEAVRYKLEFDKYVRKKEYSQLSAMVAFSGEVSFSATDPHAEGLVGETFTESGMNPDLKGRDMRTAFDSDEYHVMIVAQKFQTGFDQPKLCAMYVDKKLGGLDCVQTLSRLNRIYPGKEDTYVLDFFNDPADVLAAFQEYYQTADLLDVSDPNLIWDLYDKLRASGIFLWTEVTQFSEVFFMKSKSNAAISNVCRPAVERWQGRYEQAQADYAKHKKLYDHAKSLGDATFIANAEADMKASKTDLDALGLFKTDLVTFTRYYEFMSQIVDYDSNDLERLSLYARHLAPLLREKAPDDDPVDLTSVELSHYRLSKIKQQDLKLGPEGAGTGLQPGTDLGTGKARSREEEWLSQIITRLNDLFVTDGLTDQDLISYAYTIRDKVGENQRVMHQIANNSAEQALLGDFPGALDEAVMGSGEAHQSQMMQYLNSKELQAGFQRVVFDMLLAKGAGGGGAVRP
ncbi:MAG: type I restriction-modification system, restriction (R) subunit [Gemmatimonadota bacterium]|nr:MAG: type I restriction-modification system, restriction (R) subunit [Gemmatimonadota bacterium]